MDNHSPMNDSIGVRLTIVDGNGCSSILDKTNYIVVYPVVHADFTSPSIAPLYEPTIAFENHSVNSTGYLWDFGDFSSSPEENPEHTFPLTRGSNYLVCSDAYSQYGCNDSICKMIQIKGEIAYFVPNAFTPDGDEYNNTFKPIITEGFDQTSYEFLIFNRWGELIFESHDYEVGWDGTYNFSMCQDGTYTWKLKVRPMDSMEFEDLNGSVTLLR